MTATKLPRIIGALLKAEGSYGAGASVAAATDGILLAGPMDLELGYIYDGGRRFVPGTGANQRRVAPVGREFGFPFLHEAKGAGAAYSASVVPSLHRLLLASGFTGAVTTTGGSEKWEYTPTPGGAGASFGSLGGELYARQQKYIASGLFLNLDTVEPGDDDIPLWTFAAKSIGGAISDAVVPDITYPTLTLEPPRSVNITLVLGSFTTNAIVRRWSLAMNWGDLVRRVNHNAAGGHGGFSRSIVRNPVLTVAVEATALVGSPFHTSAGLDPFNFFDAATEVSAQLNIGSVQYNRYKIIPGKVQMAKPVREIDDESGVLYELALQCNPTTVNGNDDLMVRFD